MTRMKRGLVTALTALSLSAAPAPAQAFGPMMLLMVPMMLLGGHHLADDNGHKDAKDGEGALLQIPSVPREDRPHAVEERLPTNPQVMEQASNLRDPQRNDAEPAR